MSIETLKNSFSDTFFVTKCTGQNITFINKDGKESIVNKDKFTKSLLTYDYFTEKDIKKAYKKKKTLVVNLSTGIITDKKRYESLLEIMEDSYLQSVFKEKYSKK